MVGESDVWPLSPLAVVTVDSLSVLALDNGLGVEFVVSVSVDSVLSLELSDELCVVALISLAVVTSLLSPEALVIEEPVVGSRKQEVFFVSS